MTVGLHPPGLMTICSAYEISPHEAMRISHDLRAGKPCILPAGIWIEWRDFRSMVPADIGLDDQHRFADIFWTCSQCGSESVCADSGACLLEQF